jgi:alpha-tubulin suppressor-like RCC1 family protein
MICFGRGSEGQKVVPLEGGWQYVSAGWKHTCALQKDSSLFCWGDNRYGQTTVPSGTKQWQTVASGSVTRHHTLQHAWSHSLTHIES